jgi:hypothetical protein
VVILGPVVEIPAHLPAIQITEFAHRCRVGSQPVGNDDLGLAMALHRLLHEAQSRGFIPLPGDVAFQHLAFVIDRTPR